MEITETGKEEDFGPSHGINPEDHGTQEDGRDQISAHQHLLNPQEIQIGEDLSRLVKIGEEEVEEEEVEGVMQLIPRLYLC